MRLQIPGWTLGSVGTRSRVATAGRPCYIHVGTHKTGTTSIQVFLASNRERFLSHGVFWPMAGSEYDPGVASHHELARELKQSADVDPDRRVLDAVADELRRTDARVACISSEDLTFVWDKPAALVRLRDAVLAAGFEPRIVVYLRPQAQYCVAVYAERGGGLGPPFDYARLLDAFAAVFGRNRIIARRYRTGAPDNALLFSFAQLLLPANVDVARYHR
jgi:hypothetical protein